MFHDNTPPGKRSPSPTKPSKRKSSTQEYGCEGICDHSQESIYHFTQPPDQIKPESIEPRKKNFLLSIILFTGCSIGIRIISWLILAYYNPPTWLGSFCPPIAHLSQIHWRGQQSALFFSGQHLTPHQPFWNYMDGKGFCFRFSLKKSLEDVKPSKPHPKSDTVFRQF